MLFPRGGRAPFVQTLSRPQVLERMTRDGKPRLEPQMLEEFGRKPPDKSERVGPQDTYLIGAPDVEALFSPQRGGSSLSSDEFPY